MSTHILKLSVGWFLCAAVFAAYCGEDAKSTEERMSKIKLGMTIEEVKKTLSIDNKEHATGLAPLDGDEFSEKEKQSECFWIMHLKEEKRRLMFNFYKKLISIEKEPEAK